MTARYRCGACGNLTRFDVTVTRTTRSFHHYSLGGTLTVQDEQLLDESVHEVQCRWCGHGRAVEEIEGTEPSAFGEVPAADGTSPATG